MSDSNTNSKLFKRLYISRNDFSTADRFAAFILKKGWHYAPWEKRGTIYLQQSAFTSALIIFYARPFTRSNGLPMFPLHLLNYTKNETELHKRIVHLRHTVYAHSDDLSYKIEPLLDSKLDIVIENSPFFQLSKLEVEQLQKMIHKVNTNINTELKEIKKDLRGA